MSNESDLSIVKNKLKCLEKPIGNNRIFCDGNELFSKSLENVLIKDYDLPAIVPPNPSQELIDKWNKARKEACGVVTGLELRKCAYKKIPSGLSSLKNLEWVYFGAGITPNKLDNEISKIEGFEGLDNLKYLNLGHMKGIQKIEGLNHLTNLEDLDLNGTSISKIENIDNLKKLRRFQFNGANVTDIEGLEGLDNIEFVDMQRNPKELKPKCKAFKKQYKKEHKKRKIKIFCLS